MSRLEVKSEAMNIENEALVYAMSLVGPHIFINFMNTALELNLFDIISKSNKPLTASEIASYLPKHNPEKTPALLDRVLYFLSTYSLFDCTTETGDGDSKVQRHYALSRSGKYFIKGREGGSLVPFFLVMNVIDPMLLNVGHNLTDAIIEGLNPFEATYGLPFYQALAQHPESSKLFNSAMSEGSTLSMKFLIENYKGFSGIETLVDVGGGNGGCLKTIISAHPHIKGINFDLPHVVKDASPFPGITHVGGDFDAGVPKGDAIMLKSVLHNWEDEKCIQLLKRCYEATPENGKVIVIDVIIPTTTKGDLSKVSCFLDCQMLLILGTKERSEEEFRSLARDSGFSRVELVCFIGCWWVIEFRK